MALPSDGETVVVKSGVIFMVSILPGFREYFPVQVSQATAC
jgi:hypothetical protein